mgnify:CR=1 FL=1
MPYYITKEDTKVLVPHKQNKNFTETHVVIPKGVIVKGEPKLIDGLKKGQPYRYQIFYTDRKQIIDFNKLQPMEKTEVRLGADSENESSLDAIVNLKPAEIYSRNKIIGIVAGATLGFAYSKYKKHDSIKKSLIHAAVFAAIGWGIAFAVDRKKSGTVVKK